MTDIPYPSLLQMHIGQGPLKTPLLNRAQQLHANLVLLCEELQGLATQAPALGQPGIDSAEPLRAASTQYWQDLAPGTLVSRLDHAKALRREDLTQRAQLLGAFCEVSESGQQLLGDALEAPSSGSTHKAYAVALQCEDRTRVTLPGVVLLACAADDCCLLLFPGWGEQLFEFPNRTQAGHGLIEFMLGERSSELWAWLTPQGAAPPVVGLGVKARFGLLQQDFVEYGVHAGIASDLAMQLAPDQMPGWLTQRGQWFARALPEPLSQALQQALTADGERQAALLTFGAINPDIASAAVNEKISACQAGIAGYIGDSLDSEEHPLYRKAHVAWQTAQSQALEVIGLLRHEAGRQPSSFWAQIGEAGLTRRQQLAAALGSALQYEAQLQVYEGSLSTAAFALINQVLRQRTGPGRTVTVAELAVGEAAFSWTLPGAFVIAAEHAWEAADAALPVLLYLAGEDGGLREFGSLNALLGRVTASLTDASFNPLWGRCPQSMQLAIKPLLRRDRLPMVTRPVAEDWIESHLDAVLSAVNTEDALARALLPPRNEVREEAVELIAEQRRLQAVLQRLPAWMVGAPLAVRKQFAELQDHYHLLAAGQERYLQTRPTLIQPFTRALLAARLQTDLKQNIDPEQIQVDMPDSVEIKAVPNVPSEVRVPSTARQRWSLVELALWNVDRQVSLRLSYGQLVHRDTGQVADIDGLTVDSLRRTVIELDAAGQYRAMLETLFNTDNAATPEALLRLQVLLLPYAAAFRLQAFSAYRQGHLSEEGWLLLEQVIAARTAADLHAPSLNVLLSAIDLNLGDEFLRSGLLLIEDSIGENRFLYLPGVPEGAAIIQSTTVQGLKDSLLRRLRSPAMRTWLAGLGEVGQPRAARENYLAQAWQRDYSGFIRPVPLHHSAWPLASLLLRNRQLRLLDEARTVARSREEVRSAFARQLRDGGAQLLYSGLYYLPGIGTALQLYDGWKDANEAVAAFGQGNAALGLRRLASAEMNLGFALLLFVPGVSAATAARAALRSPQAARKPALRVAGQVARLDGFAGHEVDVSLVGAVRQRGLDAGTWKQGGKLYLWQDGKAYEVFRRSGELGLRLRRTPSNGYEHPIRLRADGRFVTHLDTGLRAGGRSRAGSPSRVDESVMADYLMSADDWTQMKEVLKSETRYTLDDRSASLRPMPGDAALSAFKQKRRQLLADADRYLMEVEMPARLELPDLPGDISHGDLLAQLYAVSRGVVIGEAHATASSKRFLIDNFSKLAAQDVKTLYFEHLLVDDVAKDLAVLNRTGVMGPELLARLRQLDLNHRVEAGQPYTFQEVVVQANKHGLEVVALDCAASWYDRGVQDAVGTARQRMFSYLATRTVEAHQTARGEHRWIALVGNSHTNLQRGTVGLAELNRAIGMRVTEPEAGLVPRLRRDPGMSTSFNKGEVKADLLLEVAVPPPSATSVAVVEQGWSQATSAAPWAPGRPRLQHPGAFYLEKAGGERVVVHLGRDGHIHRTPLRKTLGFYSLSRASWDKVHERKFWTLNDFLAAMAEQNLSYFGTFKD